MSCNYALIGLGFISSRHIDAIRATGGKLLMACDIDEKKHLTNVPCTRTYEFLTALPRWKDVNTVIICTPNHLHVEMAEWARRHGKTVICEKPFCISLDSIRGLDDGVFVMMQLRKHPLLQLLKSASAYAKQASLYVKVKRGPDYWSGWKGDKEKSGGLLFNLGVHYFDVLLQLFGPSYEIIESSVSDKSGEGKIRFGNLEVHFRVEIGDTDDGQDRYLEIDGLKYRFSDKDNLSFEDLHVKVYQDFLLGKGFHPQGLEPLTILIEKLYAKALR